MTNVSVNEPRCLRALDRRGEAVELGLGRRTFGVVDDAVNRCRGFGRVRHVVGLGLVESGLAESELRPAGELGDVGDAGACRASSEAAHAVFDVQVKCNAGKLAVAADIDSSLELLSDDLVGVVREPAAERCRIDILSLVRAEQHFEQRLAARKAPRMCGQNPVATAFHDPAFLGERRRLRRRLAETYSVLKTRAGAC